AVWQAPYQDGNAVFGQLYAADGTAVGGEFRVGDRLYNDNHPKVAAAADGSFVVSWDGWSNPDAYNVYARRYGADGTPLGAGFRVNAVQSYDTGPALAVSAD